VEAVRLPPPSAGARARAALTPVQLTRARRRRVSARLLEADDDHEVLVDEVYHHWVVYVPAAVEALLGVAVIGWCVAVLSSPGAGLLLLLALGLLGHAAWLWVVQFMDVFVITDVRVLRISGILDLRQASTPLSRILDITVSQPPLGQLLGYGHFTFESAAQEQGLRDIRFVSDPMRRDKVIQGQQMELLRRQRRNQRSS
jgi:PH (Pleckstrin Homology) domain-containing protein